MIQCNRMLKYKIPSPLLLLLIMRRKYKGYVQYSVILFRLIFNNLFITRRITNKKVKR
jgi:hypothetical protein